MSVSSYVVRLEGLPFRVTREELLDHFEDCDINKGIDGIHLIMNRDGRASGMGYVELQSGEDVENATKKSQKNIGRHNRYANIFQCGTEELSWYLRRKDADRDGDKKFRVRLQGLPFRAYHSAPQSKYKNREHLGNRFIILSMEDPGFGGFGDDRGGNSFNGMDDASTANFKIRMGGLPFKATVKEIQDWFHPEADCAHVKILLNREGRPSGEALASFETEQEAERAMVKNKEYLGERFVILTPQY